MPGNIYGVANPVPGFSAVTWLTDTVCAAGTDTIINTPTLVGGVGPGNYVVFFWLKFALSLGATPPTGISINAQVNGGSNVGTNQVPSAMLVANQTVLHVAFMPRPASNALYFPSAASFTFSVFPAAQQVTFRQSGAVGYALIFRVAD